MFRKVQRAPVAHADAGVAYSLAAVARREWWMADGLCREYPSLSWVPRKGENTRVQKEICARCAVCAECRQFGIDGRLDGIYGGVSTPGRMVLRRRAARSARAAA